MITSGYAAACVARLNGRDVTGHCAVGDLPDGRSKIGVLDVPANDAADLSACRQIELLVEGLGRLRITLTRVMGSRATFRVV